MRIAIIGSRKLTIEDIGRYIPPCEEIVSGGAKGVDACATEHARKTVFPLQNFSPTMHGMVAPHPFAEMSKLWIIPIRPLLFGTEPPKERTLQ